jgi:hypothetical protein
MAKKAAQTEKTLQRNRNEYHRKDMAERRASAREVNIDFSEQDMNRRRRLRNNLSSFCRTYFPDVFYLPFSKNQLEILGVIRSRMEKGGMQAIAAERGGGKTTIAKTMIIWGLVYEVIKWVPWIEANLELASDTVNDIKVFFEDPQGDDLFRSDFPEYCDPIRAIEGESRKASGLRFHGKRFRMEFGSGIIVLPTINPSITPNKTGACGGIVKAFGAEKAIRGLVRGKHRPDFVLVNDIETEDTAKSLVQTETIQKNINKAVKGLSGPTKTTSIVMLCTILRRGCLADQFTDRTKNPKWHGIRHRILISEPVNMQLWMKYFGVMRQEQRSDGDGSKATGFYRKNRKAMDEGCVVSNPRRMDKRFEISAIQHVMNLICDMGQEDFDCEYQNEPPEDISTEAIPPDRVCEKLSGVDQGIVPAGADKVTAFVDIHNQRLFWSIVAWKQGMIGSVIDYGVDKTTSPTPGEKTKEEADAAVDIAIYDGLMELRSRISAKYQPSLCLVDSGYRPAPVFRFCRQSVGWQASKGGSGPSGHYTTPIPDKMNCKIGSGFHFSFNPEYRQWQVVFDPDRFKKLVQEGFLLQDVHGAGSLSLYGDEPTTHRAFSEHIASEQWDAAKRKFVQVPGKNHNHWFDCMVGCMVSAAYCGIKLVGSGGNVAERKIIRLSDLQKAKHAT